jgi:RNA polymerase sigma factor (sigma-70 family)
MATGQLTGFLRRLRRVALRGDGAGPTDGELLESFILRRDETAFECLVHRHGPMVLGVCRRLLHHEADAEDAFQATFLILVRKADSVCPRSRVGGWLYGVARHTALKVRALVRRRGAREIQARDLPEAQTPADDGRRLLGLLDEELGRLPEKYRLPVVLCELEGRPLREVARQLGWPQGTVASRLARARGLLARRLARHGPMLPGALAAALAGEAARAAVPAPVRTSTLEAALHVAAGRAVTAAAPPAVAALTEGVVRRMLLNKVHRIAGFVLLAVLAVGLGLWVGPGLAQEAPRPAGAAAAAKGQPGAKPADPARAGRIYFHSHMTLTSLAPDGLKPKDLPALADEGMGYQPHSARLAPDGKSVAFGSSVLKDEGGQLSSHPPDKIFLRDLTKAAPAKVVMEMPGVELHNWCWSPDGRQLAFTSWDGENNTRNWVVDVKTKKVQRLRLPRFKRDDKEYEMGIQAWSPDGKSLLAVGNGFHLVKADGSAPRRLTPDGKGLLSGTCQFSPDGRKVLFSGFPGDFRKDKSMTLYMLDVATGKVRPVVEAKNFTSLRGCWSPDGHRIAYRVTLLDAKGEYAGESAIYVTDAEGRNTITLISEQHQPGVVRFSLLGWRRQ